MNSRGKETEADPFYPLHVPQLSMMGHFFPSKKVANVSQYQTSQPVFNHAEVNPPNRRRVTVHWNAPGTLTHLEVWDLIPIAYFIIPRLLVPRLTRKTIEVSHQQGHSNPIDVPGKSRKLGARRHPRNSWARNLFLWEWSALQPLPCCHLCDRELQTHVSGTRTFLHPCFLSFPNGWS